MNKNIRSLARYDWTMEGEEISSWGRFWKDLGASEEADLNGRQNRRKRKAAADDELTEGVQSIRTKVARRSAAKESGWWTVLKSGAFSQIPTGPARPWIDILAELGQAASTSDPDRTSILDLRTRSADLARIPPSIFKEYSGAVDEEFAFGFTEQGRQCLGNIFSALSMIDLADWENHLVTLDVPESPICKHLTEMVKLTLPAFCRAFVTKASDKTVLEAQHLHTYVHPLFREAFFRFGQKARWECGEISSDYFVQRTKADGVGVFPGRDAFPLAYFEGSRPVPTKDKADADSQKILQNLVTALDGTIKTLASTRRRVPHGMRIFGAQSIAMEVITSMLEYNDGVLFLHEIDQAHVPVNEGEVMLFVNLYELVCSFAMAVGKTIIELNKAQAKTVRPSRKSHLQTVYALAQKGE
ncbi:hypothetical protein HDU87_004966 [Geranomyces variabilis]|uniref:Uncharacterized protein n=1 Tax=Geranomyces variabilis TaxID=109894 RepID=A0AAD5TMZ9_9FUNG|nr:hypothetical protein HDU87_004966 [Geranomyces variabilis]